MNIAKAFIDGYVSEGELCKSIREVEGVESVTRSNGSEVHMDIDREEIPDFASKVKIIPTVGYGTENAYTARTEISVFYMVDERLVCEIFWYKYKNWYFTHETNNKRIIPYLNRTELSVLWSDYDVSKVKFKILRNALRKYGGIVMERTTNPFNTYFVFPEGNDE